MNNSEFIDFLTGQFEQYDALVRLEERRLKKQYINGLMTASKFFGVTYDELKSVIDSTGHCSSAAKGQDPEYLDIPAILRLMRPD